MNTKLHSRFALMNGWKDAPHLWRRFLFLPFAFEITPGWFSVSAFGFVVFWVR
jgi:hypothetical protein